VEESARRDGAPGFFFKDDAGGEMIPAADRSEYLPILFMEPPNPVPLGFDVGSEATRRAPIDQARDTGKPVASQRIRLVEDPADVHSIAVFHPVYREGSPVATVEQRRAAVRGYAAEVFRVRPVVEAALRETELGSTEVLLVDDAGPADLRVLFDKRGQTPCTSGCRVWTRSFIVADRSWTVTFSDQPLPWYGTGKAWSVLGAGALLSVLLAAVAHGLSTIRVLRRQVSAARRLGQYTLVDKLGEGGMGVVFTARHALLRRPTAIKLLPPEGGSAQRRARFEREVQLTAQLTHPNTIAVYDFGHSPDGVFYYAMEYIDGISLQELLDVEGAQPAGRVAHILQQVCGSLAEAHEVGLIHRDVKPANIMLCRRAGLPDFVKVLDFGLAKQIDRGPDSAHLSMTGAMVGTPMFISPEAITSPDEIDARTDVYAVGAVAYTLLTGAPVFDGRTMVEVCSQHLYSEPVPVSVRAPDTPPDLEALVMRCLKKKPEERYPSAGAVLAALVQCRVEAWGGADRWWTERSAEVKRLARRAPGSAAASVWVSGQKLTVRG